MVVCQTEGRGCVDRVKDKLLARRRESRSPAVGNLALVKGLVSYTRQRRIHASVNTLKIQQTTGVVTGAPHVGVED